MATRYLMNLDLRTDVESIVDIEKGIDLDMFSATNLLNEQNEKIKELKESYKKLIDFHFSNDLKLNNQQLKQKLRKQDRKINKLESKLKTSYREGLLQKQFDKDVEIEILQHSQNHKAIEELEKVRKFYNSNSDSDWIIDLCDLDKFIDNQITELRGGK